MGSLRPVVDVLSRVSSIQTADFLLTYTNNEREAKGMADLQLNDKLSQAAYLKAQDMFQLSIGRTYRQVRAAMEVVW